MKKAFTIVELLIVVVVIAILATITFVAYNGIQDQTRQSVASSAASDAAKKVQIYKIENGDQPPLSLTQAGLNNTDNVRYRYSSAGGDFCITTISGSKQSNVNQNGQVANGFCPGHEYEEVYNLIANPVMKYDNNRWLGYAFGDGAGDEQEIPPQRQQGSTPVSTIGTFMRVTVDRDVEPSSYRPINPKVANIYISSTVSEGMFGKGRGIYGFCIRSNFTAYDSIEIASITSTIDSNSRDGNYRVHQYTASGGWQCYNGVFNWPQVIDKIHRFNIEITAKSSVVIPAGTTLDIAAPRVYLTNDNTIGKYQTYKDGDSPNCIWNGKPHQSTSVCPAE